MNLATLALLLSLNLITLPMALQDMAVQGEIDPALAECIVEVETGHTWNVLQRGLLDERGLFQILPSTALWVAGEMGWQDFELADLDEPVKNMEMGLWILERYPEWYSSIGLCAD